MIGPNQIWRRRRPVGDNDLWDEIRTLGAFEGEITFTSNVGFTEVASAIAESIIDHYVQVGAEVAAEAAPWQTPERDLASRG